MTARGRRAAAPGADARGHCRRPSAPASLGRMRRRLWGGRRRERVVVAEGLVGRLAVLGGALGSGRLCLLCLLAFAAFPNRLLAGSFCHRLWVPRSHSPPQLAG